MCRFVVYLGPPIVIGSLVTEPSHSMINQSYQSRERQEPLNGDGFGVAWYAPEISEYPAVFRSISPAWSNQNLLQLARVTRSACVLAHVRAATPGMPVIETNCHPFSMDRFTFMHNGTVAGFQHVRRSLLEKLSDETFNSITGSTDSEHVFALFIDCMRNLDNDDPLTTMVQAVRASLEQVVALSRSCGATEDSCLNIAVSDGERAVVTRYTTGPAGKAESLYWRTGKRYTCEDGECRMIESGEERGAVLISSEALGDDPGWQPVPANHMVVVDEEHTARIVPCESVRSPLSN